MEIREKLNPHSTARSVSSRTLSLLETLALLANGSPSLVRAYNSRCFYSLELTSFADNQAKLQSAFKAAFLKMSVLGHDINDMIDCSEVIPEPPTTPVAAAHLPAGATMNDIEQAVSAIASMLSPDNMTCSLSSSSALLLPSHPFPLTPARQPRLLQCKSHSHGRQSFF